MEDILKPELILLVIFHFVWVLLPKSKGTPTASNIIDQGATLEMDANHISYPHPKGVLHLLFILIKAEPGII